MDNLFRKEVIDNASDRLYGSILIARPISSWLLTSGGLLIAGVILVCLFLCSYTKRTTTMGLLVPSSGAIRISPPAQGIVAERLVHEGQQVKKGEVLFVLADERRSLDLQQSHQLSNARHDAVLDRRDALTRSIASTRLLGMQTVQGLKNRLNNLQAKSTTSQSEIELQNRRIKVAIKMYEQYRQLADKHFVSEFALQEKLDQVESLNAQLLTLQKLQNELLGEIGIVQDELRQAPTHTDSQLAEFDRNSAMVAQELAEIQMHDRFVIIAPVDGTITAITAQVGQPVGSQTIAILLPENTKLVAQLYAPSKSVGFVSKGQKVRLRYQAYPYQKFGQYTGVVSCISRSPIQPNELPSALPLANQEGVYQITVQLDKQVIDLYGKNSPLIPGMMLEADIEQERRRLIEWIFEPLYGLKKFN